MSGSAQPKSVQPVPSIAQAARLRHIEALARRAQQHEGPARRLMEARLQQLRDAPATVATQPFSQGAEDEAQRAAESRPGPSGLHHTPQRALQRAIQRAPHRTPPAGLAQLLTHINSATTPTAGAETNPAPAAETGRMPEAATTCATAQGAKPPAAAPELKAISQYRSTWSRLSAEQRLHQALAQVPINAGPLNTQRLLHQALAAMRDASPHYLHRFMVQVETLLWLEQLGPGVVPVADKKPAVRKARA